MNPVLYRADERSFRTFGLGEIPDAYKVTVTRERNGNYDLYIKYPVNGRFASIFKEEMKIKSDAGKRTKWQTFEINRIVKNSSEHIEIYARHISMRTSDIALRPIVRASQVNAETALRLWKDNLVGDDVFDVRSDIRTLGNISWEVDKVGSARKALGGVSGSILDVFGGEYEFDNNLIILHQQMGRKAPTVLEYGRNLLSVEEERLLDGNYTSIYPFARYTPSSNGSSERSSNEESREILVTLPEHILDSPYLRLYAQRRISLVDFSSKFDDKHPPTVEKLRSLGQSYIKTNNIGAPKISTEVSYVDLSHTLDYQDFGVMEEVELCDIIPLYYPQFDITTTSEKVVKVVYDVYTDSNEEITLGTIGQSLSSSMTAGIADRLSVVEERQASIESTLPQYLISGTGNKIWYETPAKNVEHKIGDTWFEKNGQYQRMYIWNGSMWEKRLDTEDVDRVKKEVNRQFEEFKATTDRAITEANIRNAEALARARASADLSREAKEIANDNVRNLNTFKATAEQAQIQLNQDVTNFKNEYGSKMLEVSQTTEGIKTKIGEITSFIDKDGQRQEELKRYAREETANQTSAIRETISRDYVAKSTYLENVEGTRQRFEALTRDNETKFVEYKQGIDGRIADITSQVAGKVNNVDFQKLKETSLLYERILGKSEAGAPDKLSRLVMSSEIFQTEVGKYVTSDNNLIVNSETMDQHVLVNENRTGVNVSVRDGIFTIKAQGTMSYNWSGFTLPIYVRKIYRGETYSVGFKYRLRGALDNDFNVIIKNHVLNRAAFTATVARSNAPVSDEWKEFQGTFYMSSDFEFGNHRNFPFYAYVTKNGWVEIKEIILVRGSRTGPYKPSQFDDAYKASNKAKELATDAQTRAVQIAQGLEATRTQVTQLAGSWSVKTLNSNGDVLSALNLATGGASFQVGKNKLVVTPDTTFIANGTIKNAMIDTLDAGKIRTGKLDANLVNVVNLNASSITSGVFSGDRINGGTITGVNISGGTLTGRTKIKIGDYGSLDTFNGGMQINVPREHNSKDGIGFQITGSHGRSNGEPYGVFIYRDEDLTKPTTADYVNDYLLTVNGYISTVGINNFKIFNGAIGGSSTANIGYWSSNNVYLSFGGRDNDIYYIYNNKYYSLWEVINRNSSDERLKNNITISKHKALDYVSQFQFKEYDWNEDENRPRKPHTNIGLIAQEVQKIDPTLVVENGGSLSLDNLKLTNIALKAIQEMALENKKIIKRLENLENG